MKRRPVPTLLIAVTCLAGSASWAAAQQPLPAAVVQSGNPDSTTIAEFVKGPLEDLASDDAVKVRAAREALLSPFKAGPVSVGFRLAYTSAALPKLRDLTAKGEMTAANAIRVVSELGTPDAAALLGTQLRDQRVPNRISAAVGIKRMMDLIRVDVQPALEPADLLSLMDLLGGRVGEETNPIALDNAIRALDAGIVLKRDSLDMVRHRALTRMCTDGSARAFGLAPWGQSHEFLPPLLRAQTFTREVLTGARPVINPSEAEVRLAVGFQAHMIAVAVSNLRTLNNEPPAARQQLVDLVRVGESAVVVGLPRIGGQWRSRNLADSLAKGNAQGDKDFQRDALELFTYLQGEPFRLGPFLK